MREWPDQVKPKYKRAIFLDRDGTINIDTDYPHKVEELLLIPRALDGIRLLSELEIHLIVISNQAGIPLGVFTSEEMSSFNEGIRRIVLEAGGRLDAFYYSPFLESKNLPPNVEPNPSSKPSPGMLLEASKDFCIDLAKSFVIGDKTSDILAGKRVNCTAILVLTGKAGKEDDALPVDPDYKVADLYSAAILIRKLLLAQSSDFSSPSKEK
jgi:D-glycero-D-manno-heptose 1,7-bisphosphate phosphatase